MIDTPVSILTTFPGGLQLMIHWSYGTSYYQSLRVVYNMTGTDDFGNTYTSMGRTSLLGELIITNIQKDQ